MPFGLCAAPATFRRLIDKLIGPEMRPHGFTYHDNIITVSETLEKHLEWLRKLLDNVYGAGLIIIPETTVFCL